MELQRCHLGKHHRRPQGGHRISGRFGHGAREERYAARENGADQASCCGWSRNEALFMQ